jgi:putative tryptophan/tyrosine transport system substrate-binding protein
LLHAPNPALTLLRCLNEFWDMWPTFDSGQTQREHRLGHRRETLVRESGNAAKAPSGAMSGQCPWPIPLRPIGVSISDSRAPAIVGLGQWPRQGGGVPRKSAKNQIARRAILGGLTGIALTPASVIGQPTGKRHLIGYLAGATQAAASEFTAVFLSALHDLGYAEGRDFDIVYRFADGQFDRLPALAREIVLLNPDVIVTPTGEVATLALMSASKTIPIVSPTFGDPVRAGLVASFARPGGNVTGISTFIEHLPGKQVEFALQVLPGASRVGVLLNLDAGETTEMQQQETQAAASTLGVKMVPAGVHVPDDLDAAFQAFTDAHAEFVVVTNDGMFFTQRERIIALGAASRLPAIYSGREFVTDGGLISYGINLRENFRRAAAFVDKILKGAKPADLPVEFPTKLELVINLKTAKTLGLTIPPTLLVRADEAIE